MTKVKAHSLFTEFDINLFKLGKHFRLHKKFGSHPITLNGVEGTYFAVWAPSAKKVSVIGDFNYWNSNDYNLLVRWDKSGIWEGFIPNVGVGNLYKYKIYSNNGSIVTEKADPYARRAEHPPKTASIVWDDKYQWKDKKWLKNRKTKNNLNAPISVYEVHLGSWKKKVEENNRSLSYYELATELVNYVKQMNFTHVEFMPVMEHPFEPSWGYQITSYFAPTSRLGYPNELKYLIDAFHQNNIGVILDWVPSHFPSDDHGLGFFDGSHLYEHPNPQKGYHPDWESLIFNYERNEVRSFLISNALFWLEEYHIDGLRVDAVASMLFLDYSREEGQWQPNEHGGNENLAAISFLKELNEEVYKSFPDVQTIAEESTSFPLVSRPTYMGGLGFSMKWMMGWMNDMLSYFKTDPIYRKHHQNQITFSIMYAFSENFMLPFSHDEVVHGKSSMIGKMPGDEWQRFANLRLLYGFMYTHPGAKLLFMGSEFAQYNEWNFNQSLDWHLLQYDFHKQMQKYVSNLNLFYATNSALYEKSFTPEGFEWVSLDDVNNSVISFLRKGEEKQLLIICNFTPTVLENYKIGLPQPLKLKEVFNSDDKKYGGSGISNQKAIIVEKKPFNDKNFSIKITIPPLATLIFAEK